MRILRILLCVFCGHFCGLRCARRAGDGRVPHAVHHPRGRSAPHADAGLRAQNARPRLGDHRRPQRGVQSRHAHVRAARAAVTRAHPGLRSPGPDAARGDHGQSESARNGARARRRAQGQGPALTAPRHPRRAQGQLRHRRPAHDRWIAAPRRIGAAGRCVSREEAARGGRGDHREAEHVGVRVGRRAQFARWDAAQSARPAALTLGIVRRHRRQHRRRVRHGGHGHRHRRIDSRSLDRERHRRSQAHARTSEPRRHHPAGPQLRHRRTDGAERGRHRDRARR